MTKKTKAKTPRRAPRQREIEGTVREVHDDVERYVIAFGDAKDVEKGAKDAAKRSAEALLGAMVKHNLKTYTLEGGGKVTVDDKVRVKLQNKKCKARALDGRSLADRARDCQNLEECRKFIEEMSEGIEQANTWLDEMHTQALSAEHTRDLYAEQISDLIEAIDIDRARIGQLEAELDQPKRKKVAKGRLAVVES